MLHSPSPARATSFAWPLRLTVIRGLCLVPVVTAVAAALVSAGCKPASLQEPRVSSDTWDAIYIDGGRAGYVHTLVTEEPHEGQTLRRIELHNHLAIKRFGQNTVQDVRSTALESLDGRLRELTGEIGGGSEPIRFQGRVEGGQLRMTTTTSGKQQTTNIAWDDACRGPYAIELSLAERPMQPGERRVFKTIEPGMNEIVTEELAARGYETVELRSEKAELLAIDTTMRFSSGVNLVQTVWTDRAGKPRKVHSDALKIDAYRVSQAEALATDDAGPADMTADLTVRLAHPLKLGHSARQIRYRVHLSGKDPATVFASGPTQQVRRLDDHTAQITVVATRPGAEGQSAAAADPPTADDRQPNNLIESDDKAVVAMAAEAAGGQTDPWKLAMALEQYVYRIINKKNFSKAFDTAAKVAQTREGDCTEHSVLLAGLARARGLPARVAIGLVYVDGQQAFSYHMWTELFIAGQWIPMDATLGRAGIGAAHLKLAHTNLKGASAFSSFLPVIDVVGQVAIKVEEEQ